MQYLKDKWDFIKDWYDGFILGHEIVEQNIKAAYQNGYNTGSHEGEMSDNIQEIMKLKLEIAKLLADKKEIEKEILKKEVDKEMLSLLSIVDPAQIVTLDKNKGLIYIGGELADELTLSNLKAEAEFLTESSLWKILQETPKELAHKAMFVDGESIDSMRKGRSMLFWLSAQKNIVSLLKNYEKR